MFDIRIQAAFNESIVIVPEIFEIDTIKVAVRIYKQLNRLDVCKAASRGCLYRC